MNAISRKGLAAGALLFAYVSAVSALPITDTVTVGDQEWAQVNLFTQLSWNDLNEACPEEEQGQCREAGTLNSFDMTGWTWASYGELATASESIASSFTEFTPTLIDESIDFSRIGGWTSTTEPFDVLDLGEGTGAWVYMIEPTMFTALVTDKQTTLDSLGAWFYRPAATPVPTPATLPMLALGLLALMGIRSRRLPCRSSCAVDAVSPRR